MNEKLISRGVPKNHLFVEGNDDVQICSHAQQFIFWMQQLFDLESPLLLH